MVKNATINKNTMFIRFQDFYFINKFTHGKQKTYNKLTFGIDKL